jgi:hypothetical protein
MRLATPAGAYEIDSVPSQSQVAHCHGFFALCRLELAPVLAEIADDMLRMRYAARRKKKRTHRSNR